MTVYHCKEKGCKFKVSSRSFRAAMKKMRAHKDKKHPNWRKRKRKRAPRSASRGNVCPYCGERLKVILE